MKTAVTFGSTLRSLREEKQLRMTELASKAGISQAFLSKIESGKEKPPAEGKLRALARELDCDPDVLLALAGRLPADVIEIIQKHPRQYVALLRTLRNSSATQLEGVTGVLSRVKNPGTMPSLAQLKELARLYKKGQIALKLFTVEKPRKAGELTEATTAGRKL
jgi:HTH-type transcriptional regulator, competence development regulator